MTVTMYRSHSHLRSAPAAVKAALLPGRTALSPSRQIITASSLELLGNTGSEEMRGASVGNPSSNHSYRGFPNGPASAPVSPAHRHERQIASCGSRPGL
jgi:hypothetical protein